MNAPSRAGGIMLIAAICLAAVVVGLLINRLAIEWFLAVVLGAIALGLVFYDFRVGAVCLTVLLPWSWSTILPQAYGFNIINFLMFASVASILLRATAINAKTVWLPRELVWCYLLPIVLATMIAWQYLPIGEMNFPPRPAMPDSMFAPATFLKLRVVKPLFFIVFAFILANAVRSSKNPEWFFLWFGISAVLPAMAIISQVLSGVDVNDRGHFLSELGLQVNEYGTLLALAAGPLLFICAGTGRRLVRVGAGIAFVIVSVGLVSTASRGAVLAYIVVLAIWLLRRRRFTDLIFGVVLAVLLAVVVPDQVQERLTMGLDNVEATSSRNVDDPLTKGRVSVWAALAPDFFDSPVWGKGLSATAWNSAVTSGRIRVGHPHNMYLSIVLDMGVLGVLVVGYLYYRHGRTMARLSSESSLSPLMREYFAGAFASYIGMLFFAFTGGYYTGHPEQTFLWFSLGLCYAYWKLAEAPIAGEVRKPFGIGVRSAPTKQAGAVASRR
jgi:O-antigen ligase